MASGVGSNPFNGGSIDIRNESEIEALRRRQNRRMDKASNRGSAGGRVRYDEHGLAASSGYWKKPKRPGMKTLTDSLGNRYQTPDVIDWDDWVDMFHIKPEGSLSAGYESVPKRENMQSLADYCNWSFDRPQSNYKSVDCKAGHIERIDYHNGTKIMRVKFRSGGGEVACYFFVPSQVYATLETLAHGGQTRMGYGNVPRHLVGIYFWDLVRVRGTVHGNRYECCYTTDSGGGGLMKANVSSPKEVSRMMEDDIAKTRGVEASLRKDGAGEAAGHMESLARDKASAKADFDSKISGRSTVDEGS